MATIPELPVLSFRANWREPISERLSFLTGVLRGEEGAEQRRSLRETPRRSVEVDFLLTGPERTFWDLFVNALGADEMLVPLYWDIGTLRAPTLTNVTTRLLFDNRQTEFAPGKAIIMGATAMDYEVVTVSAADDMGITITDATKRAWPVGSRVMPLRRGVIDQAATLVHKTAAVATTTVSILYSEANPWTPAADTAPVYRGQPVWLEEPNWVDDLSTSFDRDLVRFDTGIGRLYQVDPTGRSLAGQAHRFFLHGRDRLARFRDLIYRNRGRAGAFWLPTFKADFRLVNSPVAASAQIEVAATGYGYTGGPIGGREHIAIRHAGGTILRKVLSVIPGLTAATEKLNLDQPLGLDLSPGLVRKISFIDAARFDSDDFEIVHHAGADGLHEVTTSFRNFKDTRTAPLPISHDIPVSQKTPGDCGSDIPFPGWYWRVRIDWSATLRPNPGGFPNVYDAHLPQPSGVFPNGGFVKQGASINDGNAAPNPDNGSYDKVATASGFAVRDLNGGAIIYEFQWLDVQFDAPGGYEWIFYFPLVKPGNIGWSHQFQRSQIPTGNDYPAKVQFREWNSAAIEQEVVVFRLFPQGFGVGY